MHPEIGRGVRSITLEEFDKNYRSNAPFRAYIHDIVSVEPVTLEHIQRCRIAYLRGEYS